MKTIATFGPFRVYSLKRRSTHLPRGQQHREWTEYQVRDGRWIRFKHDQQQVVLDEAKRLQGELEKAESA